MTISRRSDSLYAGNMCGYKNGTHACIRYARYLVTYEKQDRTIDKLGQATCGQHVTDAIRDIWRHHGGAVVQEIPGMWR